MPSITISREYGSGAIHIAERLCERLGYGYFDKNLMVQVAAEMGVSETDVVDFSEDTYRMRSFLERLFGRRSIRPEPGVTGESAPALREKMLTEQEGVRLIKDTIIGAYERGSFVIVGRAGQAILRDKPAVLHVRLVAPLGARALRVKDREELSLGEATNLAVTRDQAAAAYLERFFDIDWNNPMLYHLVLNTGRWELDGAIDIIASALANLKVISEIWR